MARCGRPRLDAPVAAPPAPGTVDVWRIALDPPAPVPERLTAVLDDEEQARARRFHFARDGRRFTVAHAAVRTILSRYLATTPRALVFVTGPYGKPELLPSLGRGLRFNLSHSDELALCAVSGEGAVGVDVEKIRADFATAEVAAAHFSAAENDALAAAPAVARVAAFFACWTRKEAYIKARGLGLSLPLDGFDVTLAPAMPAALLATRPNADEARRWSLVTLDVEPGYAAALATEGAVPHIRWWRWEP